MTPVVADTEEIDLSMLTEAEIEAMKFDPRAEETDAEPDEQEDTPAAEAAVAAEEVEAVAETEAAETAPEAVADGGERSRVTPVPEADRSRLDQIDEEINALTTQFDEGEISARDYNAQFRALEREAADIERRALKAEIEAEAENRASEKLWNRDVVAWMEDHKNIDVSNRVLILALDAAVREVQKDPANDKLSNMKVLDKAYASLASAFNLPKTPVPETPAKAAKPVLAPKAKPVPTLASVGAAEAGGIDDGRWSKLVRLMENASTSTEFEDTFARMSERDREDFGRYLNA